MNRHYKQVKKPKREKQPRYSDAVRKWGDNWTIDAPGGSIAHHEITHDSLDAALMRMMERGVIGRVA